MKIKHFLLVAMIAILTSCGWSEKNHQVTKPYTLVNDVELVPVKWDTGFRKVPGHYDAEGKWVPQQYVKDSVQPSQFETRLKLYVDVTPSTESVWKAANSTGWGWQWKFGVLIIIATFLVGVSVIKKNGGLFTKGGAIAFTRVFALGLILGLGFILYNPVNKSGNNQKRVTYEYYKEKIKTDPNLIQFFDSIEVNGKFVN